MSRRSIGVLIFPDFQLLDAAGPITAFEAGGILGGAPYRISVIARSAGPVTSSWGCS
jgi:transcriptional regulator GlxA family with amidase domain